MATVVVLFRVTGRGGAIPRCFAMLLQPFKAMCSSQKNGSLKCSAYNHFTRHRVLVPTSWLSLGKADMTAPPLFSGYFQIN
jgi:hypothetical protein